MEEIKCRVLSIVYKNDDNGYTVFKAEENSREITVVGTVPYINEGQFLNIKGEWIVNPKFGRQLKISECREIVPDTTKDIEKYLSSGLIYGIGPITAKKIVAKFREKTLEILDNDIEELKKVEGIGEKKLKLIMESYVGQRELKNVIMFYQSHGMSTSQCMKIYKKYGSSAIQVGRINPYMLCDEISGIGFKTSDKMAASLGIEKDSEFRISSGIRYVIIDYCANGNTFMPKNELIDEASSMLGIPKEKVEKNLYDDTASNKIQLEEINGNECVFALPYYYCELGVTKRILTLAINNYNNLNIDVDYEIKMFEDKNKISFAPSQKEAITGAATNGIEIITGGPGTGKTTIIKCIIDIFEKCGMKVLLGAPTGRAAKRMSESTGKEARTIHRLLDATVNDEEEAVFYEGESAPLDCDAVIIDEASMIDIMLMNSLLKAIKVGTRLIIVGDVDQLPSVGPGNVLSDLINSNFTKVVRLKEIFRQGKESMIVVNAHRINEGNMPLLNEKGKDFFFLNRNSPEDMLNTIIDLINTRLPRYNKSWNKMKDIQILTPTRKGMLGVTGLNEKLQSVLNPPRKNVNERKIKDTVFRVGDKVMQTKNNYTIKWDRIAGYGEEQGTGVFNGDMGVIHEINEENKSITVIFDEERRVLYDNICAEELELAYAITIHKSQGSEFPVVIMPSFMGSPFLMTRNLLYTGITRAKMLVVLVGTVGALKYMVDNVRGSDRHSALEWRIKDIVSEDIFSKE
ncbi:MAG: ATP-dependent RecD-like DNA helicase [Inconstantimicrobium porci]|uniref:ATP-dependent RecD2 DNA helicase n=1 Tax=Inconstantimicrobium porci TaxID=2652291 RepID=A0A7X2T0R6_9CLOT|nr:ATP-dependent RecD-like DNA helicase [Inconstantimicrobium porci]MDD6771542.1 ATP-dependent RecD-like DNA helicase [Inconstantimicrobium porci]MDY5910942.1 ATP-dependent RecD-like DNA helicase [Inconstantimicrobium porci]MSR90901.1 ATP-dependent RecD-like DNA helicase [Inconstantimicrobium porci]